VQVQTATETDPFYTVAEVKPVAELLRRSGSSDGDFVKFSLNGVDVQGDFTIRQLTTRHFDFTLSKPPTNRHFDQVQHW